MGITRLIGLRGRAEREIASPPFLSRAEYLNLPLLPYRSGALNTASAEATSNGDHDRAHPDHAANEIIFVLGAILDAPPGPVQLHCHAGKDCTGLVVALCLEVAGLAREHIAADYAASGPALEELYAVQCARLGPERWAAVAPFAATRPEDILAALEHLDSTWGGVGPYLTAYGFGEREQALLTPRLLAP